MREKINMDNDWKFHLGDFTNVRNRWAWGKSGSWNQGPESIKFDDSEWRNVNIPHDFVIESEPTKYMVNEFGNGDNVIPEMQTVSNMHTTTGSFKKDIGWYRKHFYIPKEDEGKKIYFIFDGIYKNSSVYLNNFFVEFHRSGYAGMKCDITDLVNYGGDNVISVKVDSREAEGWFYEGGGIYRHTYLLKQNKIHIEDVFVSSDVNLEDKTAKIKIKTQIVNELNKDVKIRVKILNPNNIVEKIIIDNISEENQDICLDLYNVKLWDIESPNLYKVIVSLYLNNEILDEYNSNFGIRKIFFDADKGFFLNGRNIKIKGVCCHQNHGGLGAALPDELYTYRIKKLKEMGANAYRTSHYPPTPELLNVCDKLGVLVMDETRLLSSAKENLEQLEFMVKRDRNHPSVILYSIGNEEAQSQATPQGAKIAGTMIKTIKKLDNTRPVTMGLLMWDLAKKCSIENVSQIAGISEKLDVAGFNYHDNRWEEYHSLYPRQPMISTENGTFKSTRGCYKTDEENCHLSIIDKTVSSYMMGAKQWHNARVSYMSGLFLWTGFDYYGEPTPYAWPAISSQFGIMDICGYPKDYYYYYKAWWKDEPVLHIFPHWNGIEGEIKDIHIFSNCDEVELFVNGTSKGKKNMETDGYLEWDNIVYEKGEISAKGYKNGKLIIENSVKTTENPSKIDLSIDFMENEIVIIKVEIQDKNGLIVPDACNEYEFEIEGEAEILGCSNGNPSEHINFKGKNQKVFNGLAQIIVKKYGELSIKAFSKSLTEAELYLK